MKNFRWSVALLAFLLTLGATVGMVNLRQRQMINEPLLKRLAEYEGVEAVELLRQGETHVIYVKLAYVSDLASAYNELDKEVSRLLGQKRYRLKLLDKRDHALEAAFAAVHLALYEGEHRGNFMEMGDQVSRILAGFNLSDHRLGVDNRRIYFQARRGEAYLYEIIERESRKEGERA